MKNDKIIKFPPKVAPKSTKKQMPINHTGDIKYYNKGQVQLLRRTARDKAILDQEKGKLGGIREWMAIDLLTTTGIRVSEAANLRCGDFKLGYSEKEIFVRDGKGSKPRTIQIPESLKKHLKQFLRWKESRGEPTDEDDHLFVGQRGPWTSQAIQQVVKKYLKALGLYESGKSVHALRHSYAVELYRKEKDLRAVQKQLGHSSVQSTLIYADVTKEDIQGQVKNFWN